MLTIYRHDLVNIRYSEIQNGKTIGFLPICNKKLICPLCQERWPQMIPLVRLINRQCQQHKYKAVLRECYDVRLMYRYVFYLESTFLSLIGVS